MNRYQWHLVLGAFLAAAPSAWAQRAQFGPREPHVGYVYPAGGQQGADFEITVGGQYLNGTTEVFVSGKGVQTTVVTYDRPLNPRELNELRNKMQEVQKRVRAEMQKGNLRGGPSGYQQRFLKIAEEVGVSREDIQALEEYRKQRTDPKRQLNPQLAETVTVQISLDPDAPPGARELRLKTGFGLSNPLSFQVGQLPEYNETEPNDKTADSGIRQPLPLVVNGQILPGDVDRFRFEARQGTPLVVAVSARELIPYLADAVPGWFQATVALYDANGSEVAYADDYRFHPDPVLHYEIPQDGQYVLEIKDAIYRGRQDFVYRIALGEIPFVTSIFPLGGRSGAQTTVAVKGWNLPVDTLTLDAEHRAPGIHPISMRQDDLVCNRVPFAVDTLPECLENEPNNERPSAQQVKLPLIINGRVDRPGDRDVFRFEGRAGDKLVAEVQARRLNSPLDSLLKLTDETGHSLAVNDDHEDKSAGLTTHHADSRLSIVLPQDGAYYLSLGDTQSKGGSAYGYRLHISPERPDFELRVVPSSINARAGATVPLTVYALRKDGFAGEITLELTDAPPGFTLSGGWIPANQDKVRLTLTAPPVPLDESVSLWLEGRAVIQGKQVYRSAIPAEDMMQAFIYRHLVPAKDWMVTVTGGRRFQAPLRLLQQEPLKLPAGGTAQVRMFTPATPFMEEVQLSLSEPPEGIVIQKVSPIQGGVAIQLSAAADKTKPGLKGNLIVEAFMERAFPRRDGKPGPKRRIPLGTLPAIPFEIVGL